jgi:GGDEF domain-containing protein
MWNNVKNEFGHLIFAVQILFFYFSIEYFLKPVQLNAFIIQYILLLILFTFIPYKKGFILLAAYILTSGIGYLILVWVQTGNVVLQVEVVLNHITNVVNWALMYGSISIIKSIEEKNFFLKTKVDELSKYIGETKLLSRNEFEERSQILIKAMERRNENGYLIFFDISNIKVSVKRAVFDKISEIALFVFRNEYDLIGKWEEDVLVILLQNTDEEGKKIAINRYYHKINEFIDISEKEISFRSEIIGSAAKNKEANI